MLPDEVKPSGGLEPPRGDGLPTPDLLRAILDGVPAMIGYWDRDLRNRMANSAYADWFGLSPEQMGGMHMRDVLGTEPFENNRAQLAAALAGKRQEFDRKVTDVHGDAGYTHAAYIPDMVDGEVRGFFALVTDVTARVLAESKARRSADQYRALVRSIPGGFVLLFDTDLRCLVADGEGLSTFGYRAEDLEGRTLQEAYPEALAAELEPRYRTSLTGHSVSWERTFEERVFNLTAGPVRDETGTVIAGNVVCTDVTAERRAAATERALHAIATLVAGNAAVDDVVDVVAERMHDVFAFDQAGVLKFESRDSATVLAMNPEMPSISTMLMFTPNDPSAAAQVARTGAPALATYETSTEGASGELYASGLRSGGAAPIRLRGQLWGAVAIGSVQGNAVDESALDRLASFAELVEIAIANASAWSELNRLANTDAITGLLNRRSFEEHLARAVAEADRHERPISVAVIDIDHFKRINDEFGHAVGDRVIAEVGHRLSAAARGHEIIARIGGEEFAWLLPDTDAESAWSAAERARLAIAGEPFAEVDAVTASIGVCDRERAGREPHLLLDRADQALYAAKRAGRNRSVCFSKDQTVSAASAPGA